MTTALITGIGGQDGYYLAQLLKEKDYRVCGLVRSASDEAVLAAELPHVERIEGDLLDAASLVAALDASQPDEVYNLGARSSVSDSWDETDRAAETTALGALRLLEAIRSSGLTERVRFYQASSSEMYGLAERSPQDEQTPFAPVHPYAAAKVFAHTMTVIYRQTYGMFAVGGVMFNHDSPRRSERFVFRKVTAAAARIALGLQDTVSLGNLEARRDWGYAPEYVDAMWRTLQVDTPEDYVIATGRTHSVRELVETAFACAGVDDWQRHVEVDTDLLRPTDISELRGDPGKAGSRLGWRAETPFDDLVRIMVDAELERARAPRAGAEERR